MSRVREHSRLGAVKLSFAFFVCAFAFLLLGLRAGAEGGSPYDIYVGNMPVTEENRGDILGDGTARYDADSDTLYLTDYSSRTTSSVGGIYFSVFCNEQTDIFICGESNTFIDAVYTRSGNIKIDNTYVTFTGSAFIMLLTRDGNISCSSSRINIKEIGALAHHGIEAQNISFASCTVECSPRSSTIYSSDASLFSAKENLLFDHCTLSMALPYPMIGNIFDGTDISLRFSHVDISGANMAAHAPGGSLNIVESELCATDTRTFSLSGAVNIYKSKILLETFYNGIQVSGDSEQNTVSVIRESEIDIRMLDFDRMLPMLLYIYREMSEDDREGKTAEEMMESVRLGSYAEGIAANCGYAFASTDITVYKSRLSSEGYRVGFYGAFGATLKLSDAVVLRLKSRQIAFLFLVQSSGSVVLPTRMLSGKYSVMSASAQGSALEHRCGGVVSFATGTPAIAEGEEPQTLGDVLSLISGCASAVTVRTSPYVAAWVWLLVLGVVFAVGIGVSAFFIFFRSNTATGKAVKRKK